MENLGGKDSIGGVIGVATMRDLDKIEVPPNFRYLDSIVFDDLELKLSLNVSPYFGHERSLRKNA